MKQERIFIEITELDDGSRLFMVGGGIKDKGQMESFGTAKECLEEIENRTIQTLLEM